VVILTYHVPYRGGIHHYLRLYPIHKYHTHSAHTGMCKRIVLASNVKAGPAARHYWLWSNLPFLSILAHSASCCVYTSTAPSRTLKRRSEIDRRLESLVSRGNGRLKEHTAGNVIKVRQGALLLGLRARAMSSDCCWGMREIREGC
jgi:hypothetical protein